VNEPSSNDITARRLDFFIQDCETLDIDAFCHRHARAFLLHNGPLDQKTSEKLIRKTLTMGAVSGGKTFQPQKDFLVWPIKHSRKRTDAHVYSVGREETNDVVIQDESLTLYHAFFKYRGDNGFTILDAASKNGTFLDDRQVPAWGQGEPLFVDSGARIRFGSIEFTFLLAAEFIKLVNRLSD
jgi:FHA domain-containing protein